MSKVIIVRTSLAKEPINQHTVSHTPAVPATNTAPVETTDMDLLEAQLKKLCDKNEHIFFDNKRVSEMNDKEFDPLKAIPLMRTNIRLYAEAQVLKARLPADAHSQLSIVDRVIDGARKMIQNLDSQFDNWQANNHDFSEADILLLKTDVEKKALKVRTTAEKVIYMADEEYNPENAYGTMRNAFALSMKARMLSHCGPEDCEFGFSDDERKKYEDVAAMAMALYNVLHDRFLWVLFGEMNYAATMVDTARLYTAIRDVDAHEQETDTDNPGEEAPEEEGPTEAADNKETPFAEPPEDEEQQTAKRAYALAWEVFNFCDFPYNGKREEFLFNKVVRTMCETQDADQKFILETARLALFKLHDAEYAINCLKAVTTVNAAVQQADKRLAFTPDYTEHALEKLSDALNLVQKEYVTGSDIRAWAKRVIDKATQNLKKNTATWGE